MFCRLLRHWHVLSPAEALTCSVACWGIVMFCRLSNYWINKYWIIVPIIICWTMSSSIACRGIGIVYRLQYIDMHVLPSAEAFDMLYILLSHLRVLSPAEALRFSIARLLRLRNCHVLLPAETFICSLACWSIDMFYRIMRNWHILSHAEALTCSVALWGIDIFYRMPRHWHVISSAEALTCSIACWGIDIFCRLLRHCHVLSPAEALSCSLACWCIDMFSRLLMHWYVLSPAEALSCSPTAAQHTAGSERL